MTYDYVLKKVQTIVSDQVGRDTAFCGADADLVRDLGADSLDVVSVVLDVETELGIEISGQQVEVVETIGDLAKVASHVLRVEVPA